MGVVNDRTVIERQCDIAIEATVRALRRIGVPENDLYREVMEQLYGAREALDKAKNLVTKGSVR